MFQELIMALSKVNSLKAGINLIVAYISASILPVSGLFAALYALIIIDLITGIWGAIKTKEPLKSRQARGTITKVVSYSLVIAVGLIMDSVIDFLPWTKTIAGFCAIVEFWSIGENFSKITGLPFLEYLKTIIPRKFHNPKNKSL